MLKTGPNSTTGEYGRASFRLLRPLGTAHAALRGPTGFTRSRTGVPATVLPEPDVPEKAVGGVS